jgi:IS5 family transposase
MSQLSFSDAEGQAKKRKVTRREKFLNQMEALLPWKELERPIARYYSKSLRGRKPYPLSVMLRIHCMQLFYNLSDPAMEDTLYEVQSMRQFAGVTIDTVPDETTILNFRHLLEEHNLGEKLFHKINKHLEKKGLSFKEGTIMDASIIAAPSSTRNQSGARDPEMHQTKKGNQWHFGMKVHVGVDDTLGLIHSLTTTAANTHDLTPSHELLHGKEHRVFGDAGYMGIQKREEHRERSVDWLINVRHSQRREHAQTSPFYRLEQVKSQIRSKVEHVFSRIKNQFGYNKVRYRGLHKNTNRLYLLAGFTNLLRVKRKLM